MSYEYLFPPEFRCWLQLLVTDMTGRDVIKQLDLDDCKVISVSPNKPNIFYSGCKWSAIKEDLSVVYEDLLLNGF